MACSFALSPITSPSWPAAVPTLPLTIMQPVMAGKSAGYQRWRNVGLANDTVWIGSRGKDACPARCWRLTGAGVLGVLSWQAQAGVKITFVISDRALVISRTHPAVNHIIRADPARPSLIHNLEPANRPCRRHSRSLGQGADAIPARPIAEVERVRRGHAAVM